MVEGFVIGGAFVVLLLLIGAVRGLTLHQVLWVLGDVFRDPIKWLRPRDERGRLRPTRKDGNRYG